ncbi:hypothetical protein SERLADRAFT_447045 [Serpula lacrymans var. lacrymans S7.9]|uniref:MFS general substrate transporter n=1 Tax=Serpula lacrymans var. lacrymans (strain S7.9) TaxID=578457 RepID=F8NM38_SERL9|nr:uncharacterized protein SERLADRAFT_447045 [Serpula lacrymans var. lacrymans S7.9]EGO27826.1 hypothetical protein SERLADRAFT_447045 [Serpula lacrymans var. lacrymans S7.9]
MTFPVNTDADPDPTTQMTWPSTRHRQRTGSGQPQGLHDSTLDDVDADQHSQDTVYVSKQAQSSTELGKTRLTTWNLITLSISMAGAQVAWTVELGYGTPFLLSLGISEQLTSLVWLAGPLSGLIAQPLIGAISDSSTSKYRRRYWVILSTIVLGVSTLGLAYCQSIAAFFVDLFAVGAGDWDPQRAKQAANTAIGLAIFFFYLLDFALNALQASLRNLLLDITPPDQLNAGNAWHGRMAHAGNIIGYGFGYLPLAQLPLLRLLGGDQFRKFCVVTMIVLTVTVWITCFCHEEKESRDLKKGSQSKLYDVLQNIYNAVVKLPKPIRRVCFVQVFAFMGWFPFLFYATTYIGQIMAYQNGVEPDKDVATRRGEFALLLYSLVAVAAGTLLPHLARRDRRLLPREGDNEEEDFTRLRAHIRHWQEEATRHGKTFRLPRSPIFLRDIWTGALILFTVITFSTFFISTVPQATAAISLIGICWAVACWVPFAIIMEFLKELDSTPPDEITSPNSQVRAISTSAPSVSETDPLIQRSVDGYDSQNTEAEVESTPTAGGTILGIHNLAIVMPQFVVAVVSSVIFRIVDESSQDPTNHDTYLGRNGVAWVLRFGGFCTLIGALISRMVPLTRTEKGMRRQLVILKELKAESAP